MGTSHRLGHLNIWGICSLMISSASVTPGSLFTILHAAFLGSQEVTPLPWRVKALIIACRSCMILTLISHLHRSVQAPGNPSSKLSDISLQFFCSTAKQLPALFAHCLCNCHSCIRLWFLIIATCYCQHSYCIINIYLENHMDKLIQAYYIIIHCALLHVYINSIISC